MSLLARTVTNWARCAVRLVSRGPLRRQMMNEIITISPFRGTVAAVFLLGVLLSGCATIKTGSHHDESQSFNNYRTFAWIAENPLVLGVGEQPPISPLSRHKIVEAIKDELGKKGFTYLANADNADFVISYSVGTREKIDARSYPSVYQGEWGWHIYGRYYYQTEIVHRSYTEGTLGIDVFDGATKQPVWHGWATKTISPSDRENPSSSIRKAVAGIFQRFPPEQ